MPTDFCMIESNIQPVINVLSNQIEGLRQQDGVGFNVPMRAYMPLQWKPIKVQPTRGGQKPSVEGYRTAEERALSSD